MNAGKKFESNFRDSVPDDVFYYRFRDGTSNWRNQDKTNTRFQQKNICDCMLHDGKYLYLLELKSHKGKSLPLSAIRENQIKSLLEADKHKNIIAGLIVNFSDIEETYFMDIKMAYKWFYNGTRKSIPLSEFRTCCMPINAYRKKVNYQYALGKFIKDVWGMMEV